MSRFGGLSWVDGVQDDEHSGAGRKLSLARFYSSWASSFSHMIFFTVLVLSSHTVKSLSS
jgi:hypothetical protein